MTSCNNDELANHVLAREEKYARTPSLSLDET